MLGKFWRDKPLEGMTAGGCRGEFNERFVAKDKVRRSVGGSGFRFAPMPDFAKDRKGGTIQAVAAFKPPNNVGIGLPNLRAIGDEPGTGFLMPAQAAFGFQVALQPV